ncbi:MAG: family 10 glycosylhydrolase [Bacteroidales bacterium]|nr:family 10 glycosylhydrolase [Bacteroidales bacterium]
MKKYLLSILASVLVLGCVKDPEDKVEEPEVTPEPPQPEVVTGKPRYVWIDASANFYYYANDKVFLAAELEKLAGCGFTDIVVDVRPTESTVLWKSSVAPEARRLAAWVNGSYKFVNRTATWDYLQAFIDAGHASGLRVHAAINTFVCGYGGYYGLESEGPVFTGDIPEGWAAMDNTSDGIKSSFYPGVQGTVFMNPANQEVQKYVLNLLKELAAYKVDGIILDRCRYDDTGLQSEFSPESKAAFTEYLGREPDKWPVFGAGSNPSVFSPYQKSWLSFRVKTIHDFVEKAAATVHGVNPDIKFGVYVGAWYSDYYSSGVNWASPRYDTGKYYPKWADSDYRNYGFADHCDQMLLGCYASASSIYGSTEWTMEGFCKRAQDIILGDAPFAGGPDVGNPSGWENGGRSADIPKTVDACINSADGYFVFDLCHIRMYDYWNSFKTAFDNYINSLTQ